MFSVHADDSADPDKMPPYSAFHLSLHCLNLYYTVYRMKRKMERSCRT